MLAEKIFAYIYDERFLYQVTATLATYITLQLVQFYRARNRRFKLFAYYGIPGPKPRLFDGCLYLYGKKHYQADQKMRDEFGPNYAFFIGDDAIFVTTDLDKLKMIFLEKFSSFKERGKVFIESPLSEGLLFARYHRWKPMRKVMTPEFAGYKVRGGQATQFIEDSVKLMLQYIEDSLDEAKANGKEPDIDMHNLMKSMALHMISSMAIKLPDVQVKEGEEYVQSLDSFLDQTDDGLIPWAIKFPFLKRILEFIANNFEFDKLLSKIRKVLNGHIEEGLKTLAKPEGNKQGLLQNGEQKQPKQLLDTLIKLHFEGKLSRTEVIGNAEAVLFAGYDTTSTTLAYIFWVMSKYPEIQEKLRVELMAHGIESEYLTQVINEVMRLYPTVISFTTRMATETVDIDGVTIPQGTKVIYNAWLIYRNPEIWPEPEKFDPERFRKDAVNHPCAFAPFGMGERKCIGYQLALLEIKMVVCDILLRYRLKLVSPNELSLLTHGTVLTEPEEKIKIKIERV